MELRSLRQKVGVVLVGAEPRAMLTILRNVSTDEAPKRGRVIVVLQVRELVRNHVVDHLEWRDRESPVERHTAA